jgi:hypothetical protein
MGHGWECKMGFESIDRRSDFKRFVHLALLAPLALPHAGLFALAARTQPAADQLVADPEDARVNDQVA